LLKRGIRWQRLPRYGACGGGRSGLRLRRALGARRSWTTGIVPLGERHKRPLFQCVVVVEVCHFLEPKRRRQQTSNHATCDDDHTKVGMFKPLRIEEPAPVRSRVPLAVPRRAMATQIKMEEKSSVTFSGIGGNFEGVKQESGSQQNSPTMQSL